MTKKKYTSDLFISYATEDFHDGVSDIFMALFEIGITSSWLDQFAIKPGDSIPNKIDEGLRSTRYLLPVVSNTYFDKQWTRAELDAVRMLSKPAIPIWINVEPKDVLKFSPLLGAQKAIIYESNPYEVAEQVGEVLINNKRTHFYKGKTSREEAQLFWNACYFYILTIVEGKRISECDLFKGKIAEPDSTGKTLRANVEEAIDISLDDMNSLSNIFYSKARKLGKQLSNEEVAHLICGDIKRRKDWFPHEPREHFALAKLGLDRF